MEFSSQMLLFSKVVEHGSFSAAAREINHSPSAVSKQIGALEDQLGLRLLTRTQAGIALTEEGRVFHGRCAELAAKVAEAKELVEGLASGPRGVLKLRATVAFGKSQILPILPAFFAEAPEVQVSLELSDRPVDFVTDEVDVAIRFSEQIDNEALIVRKLAPNQRVLVAAPSYLKAAGVPQRLEDLTAFNCLRLSTVETWNTWRFETEAGPVTVPVSGNFEASSADAVYHAALAGIGVARLSTYLVNDDLDSGRLVRILPGYSQNSSAIFAVYPERRHLSPKVRVFLDFLTRHFGRVPPWERGRDGAESGAAA